MKKVFYCMTLVAMMFTLTACPPDNGEKGNGVATEISILPAEDVVLAEGGSIKLTITAKPDGAKIENVVWETTDTLVATVNERGLVTAQYPGECIIKATMGNLVAERKVSVKSFLETIQFTQAILWDEDTTYAQGKVDTIESTSGETFYAYKSMGELWLCSEGFFVNNEGRLDGAEQAAVITVYAPFYYATATLNNTDRGTVFTLGEWIVSAVDSLKGRAHVGAPGAINENSFYQNMDGFFQAYVQGDAETYVAYLQQASADFTGATINEWTYNVGDDGEGGYSYSYIPAGIISEADFSLNGNGSSNFMCGLDFCFADAKILDGMNYWWGVNPIVDDNDQYTGIEHKLYWADPIQYRFGEYPTQVAKKQFEPLNVPVIKIDCPEVAARIEAVKNNSKVLIRK
ncbi:MAG: Ig-like domain-containing protein [Bacteroidales bacterium]|nr:Ig-like domain-containing protein [Candidatus Colicola faecequi]